MRYHVVTGGTHKLETYSDKYYANEGNRKFQTKNFPPTERFHQETHIIK